MMKSQLDTLSMAGKQPKEITRKLLRLLSLQCRSCPMRPATGPTPCMQRRLNARSLVSVVATNALASNLPNGDEVPVVSDLFVTLAVCTT